MNDSDRFREALREIEAYAAEQKTQPFYESKDGPMMAGGVERKDSPVANATWLGVGIPPGAVTRVDREGKVLKARPAPRSTSAALDDAWTMTPSRWERMMRRKLIADVGRILEEQGGR